MFQSKAKKIYCLFSVVFAILVLALVLFGQQKIYAANVTDPGTTDELTVSQGGEVADAATDATNGLSIIYNNENGTMSSTVRILLVLTVLSLAPSILIMLTSFTRILIVLHFTRAALGTQTAPPNQVLIGLALFLTFMIMSPVFTQINEEAIKPLDAGTITQEQAEHHPQKNIITRALGVDYRLEPEFTTVALRAGDVLLLCTDGLTNAVPTEQLEQLLRSGSFYDLPDVLIRTANENGGPDNITALLVGVEPMEVRHG